MERQRHRRMESILTDQLNSLIMHHRAQQLLNTYTRYVDSKNFEAMASIAHPEIELVRSTAGTSHGREAFVDLYRSFASSDVVTSQHMTTNLEVTEQQDGTLAVAARFVAITTHPEAGARYTWGRYEDEMVEYEGKLVFKAKRIQITRTALISEDMLAPEHASSFDQIAKA